MNKRPLIGSVTFGMLSIIGGILAYGVLFLMVIISKEEQAKVPVLYIVGPIISLSLIVSGVFFVINGFKIRKVKQYGHKGKCHIVDMYTKHFRYVTTYYIRICYRGDSGRYYEQELCISKKQYETISRNTPVEGIVYKEYCLANTSNLIK